jgi:hypothetical protein
MTTALPAKVQPASHPLSHALDVDLFDEVAAEGTFLCRPFRPHPVIQGGIGRRHSQNAADRLYGEPNSAAAQNLGLVQIPLGIMIAKPTFA